MELTFEWDEDKARENLRKHKVSFDEARTVLMDPVVDYDSRPRPFDGRRTVH